MAAIGLSDPGTGKMYTDLTERFQLTSNKGMHYMLILYAYDKNQILVKPNETKSDTGILRHIMPCSTH